MNNSKDFVLPSGERAFAHVPINPETGLPFFAGITVGNMDFKDGPALDAFGNLRVSSGIQLFGSSQEYNFGPLLWDHYTAGGGTATHSTDTNSTVLSTAAATSGNRALRQTKVYHRYTPGKSQLAKLTGTLRKGAAPAGTAFAGIGYYDDRNGLFFRDASAGAAVVVRSDTSGSVVDTAVAQADWNLDRMDGDGPSQITADWTKEQIFIIDFQWLGVGRVRFGLAVGGKVYYVHESLHANLSMAAYIRTGCLPLRIEAFNSGGAGANISIESICASVDSEGGVNEDAFYSTSYSAYIGAAMSLDTTLRPVVTRRLRDTFNGLTVRGRAHLNGFDLLVGTNNIYWEILYNPTVTLGGGGSAVTANVDATNSISEFDMYAGAANTVAGGLVVANGFAVAGSGSTKIVSSFSGANARPLLGRTYAGVRDSFTLAARSLSGAATLSFAAQLREQY